MHATGTLYLGKARPVADTAPDGEFRLTLLLIDNLGGNEKESYRVRWSGPQAQAFWQARSAELVPGATDTGHPGSEAGCVPSVAGFILMILACLGCAALVIDFIEMALSA